MALDSASDSSSTIRKNFFEELMFAFEFRRPQMTHHHSVHSE